MGWLINAAAERRRYLARAIASGGIVVNSRSQTRARAFIGGLLAGAIALSCGGVAFAAAPAIKLNPVSDHPTATDQVSGSGFGASEAVDIYFDTTDMLLATTTATGTIAWHPWQVPANATPGEHWITAIGRKSGDAAQKPFTVATDWPERGFSVRGKRINPYENVLTTANVSSLDIAWSTTTGGGIASSPAVANGVVYAGSLDGKFYAFDAATGAVLWTATIGPSIYSSPAVAKGAVYVGGADHKLYAYNAATGAVLWSATTGAGIYSSPAVANGVVYVGSADDKLYAFNASTGALLWTATTGNIIESSSPAVANGVVFVGSDDEKLYAFNASTGALLWSVTTASSIKSSPAVANGAVYIASEDKKLYAYKAGSGALLWSATTGNAIYSSPSYEGHRLYRFERRQALCL